MASFEGSSTTWHNNGIHISMPLGAFQRELFNEENSSLICRLQEIMNALGTIIGQDFKKRLWTKKWIAWKKAPKMEIMTKWCYHLRLECNIVLEISSACSIKLVEFILARHFQLVNYFYWPKCAFDCSQYLWCWWWRWPHRLSLSWRGEGQLVLLWDLWIDCLLHWNAFFLTINVGNDCLNSFLPSFQSVLLLLPLLLLPRWNRFHRLKKEKTAVLVNGTVAP